MPNALIFYWHLCWMSLEIYWQLCHFLIFFCFVSVPSISKMGRNFGTLPSKKKMSNCTSYKILPTQSPLKVTPFWLHWQTLRPHCGSRSGTWAAMWCGPATAASLCRSPSPHQKLAFVCGVKGGAVSTKRIPMRSWPIGYDVRCAACLSHEGGRGGGGREEVVEGIQIISCFSHQTPPTREFSNSTWASRGLKTASNWFCNLIFFKKNVFNYCCMIIFFFRKL